MRDAGDEVVAQATQLLLPAELIEQQAEQANGDQGCREQLGKARSGQAADDQLSGRRRIDRYFEVQIAEPRVDRVSGGIQSRNGCVDLVNNFARGNGDCDSKNRVDIQLARQCARQHRLILQHQLHHAANGLISRYGKPVGDDWLADRVDGDRVREHVRALPYM